MTALDAMESAEDPWVALGIRLAVLAQFGCFLYIINTHGISSTLCQVRPPRRGTLHCC